MIHNEDDKVWCTITRTINLGNYESIKVEAGISETVDSKRPKMNRLSEICDEVFDIVFSESKTYKRILKKKPKKEEE